MPSLSRRGDIAVGCRGCILDGMGENTFRDAPGAPGIREAGHRGAVPAEMPEPVQSVPAGSYTAYAMDGSLVSAPVTVRLT